MPETTDDNELIRRFIEGDERAFNLLAMKYQQRIYWHARRMTGSHDDADDVLQEVLLVLYKKLKEFRQQSTVYTWIYRVTATRAINYIRKKNLKRFFSLDQEDAEELIASEDIVTDYVRKEKLAHIEKLLQKLPVKQREVFVMRHYDELSYEEIAEITGKSVGGLKANYYHAWEKLNALMETEYEKH